MILNEFNFELLRQVLWNETIYDVESDRYLH